LSYRKSRKKDWLKTVIYISLYLTVLAFSGIFLLLSYWYVWVTLAVSGLTILILWHSRATAYHCPRCNCKFEISLLTDLFSPHGVNKKSGWKYLKCPNCSNRSKMETLVKTKGEKENRRKRKGNCNIN